MSAPIAGINEKLKRANETIGNLKTEVTRFFKRGKSPIGGRHSVDSLQKAVARITQQPIPPRFAVLTGEVIHHLRSCLDHIAWQLSSTEYRRRYSNRIEFPVLSKNPADKGEAASYERKVGGLPVRWL